MRPHLLIVALLFVSLIACGDDVSGPAGDVDAALVGPWRQTSTNTYDLLEVRLRAFLANLATPGQDADSAAAAVVANLRAGEQFLDPDEVLTFGDDGTWRSSLGTAGRWRTADGVLTMTGVGGSDAAIAYTYAIAGDAVTMATGRDAVLVLLAGNDAVDAAVVGLFTALFTVDDRFVFTFTRHD